MRDFLHAGMDAVRKRLANVIASREDDFLHLGESLHAMASRSDILVDMAQELVNSTIGEVLEEVVHQLDDKMAAMRTMCSTGDSDDQSELQRIRSVLEELLHLLDNYGRIVRTLQMLAISTRIESARLGADGRGFDTLADDVEKLGHKIVESSVRIRHQAEVLDALAEETGAQMTAIHAMQQDCSENLSGAVLENLAQLNEYGDNLSTVSRDLNATVEAIQGNMGDVVSSMQFHDIVRQQVEHVEEVLEEAASYFAHNTHDAQDEARWLRRICVVQAAQLEYAEDSFTRAVQTLRDALGRVAELVGGLSALMEPARHTETKRSPLQAISGIVQEITQHFIDLAQKGGDVGNVMVRVANTVTEMTAFLDDIEEVGAEIELIALNASIKAAHTGDMGKALGVLATSIQHLSQDARTQTDGISGQLQTIAASADHLREAAHSYLDRTQADTVTEELSGFMAQLHFVQDKADTLLTGLDTEAAVVARELAETVDAICIDIPVGEALRSARADLLQLFPDGMAEEEDARDLPEGLRSIMDRYTMESERDIHRSHFDEANAGTELFDDGLDDNVELF